MNELVVISKDELEKMLRDLVTELVFTSREEIEKMVRDSVAGNRDFTNNDSEEKFNQKEAASYLGITQSTLIRWKKNGLVPVQQLPGSNKVTYYKSDLKKVMKSKVFLLRND